MNRRNVLAALPALLAAELAEAANIQDSVVASQATSVTREGYGEARIYFDGSTRQLKALTAGSVLLNAGMEPHPPHQHPEEEILLVTKGSGEITIDGKSHAVASGAMMYCAGGRLHGIRNTGSEPLLFYFYKWQA
jgi:quercetin dioxygenase-like cupin family protein